MLSDNFGRTINYLRLSVTDRCDFRCVYCMAEDMEFVPRQQLLTLEEASFIASTFVELGVNKIRITGGEPLIRRDVMTLFRHLGKLDPLKELTLTTNGSHLSQYAQSLVNAGVQRVNVSLDSLQANRFADITRTGQLSDVLQGIDDALAHGLKIKLNSVILKHRNADEIITLVDFACRKGIDISFIEEMPLGVISEHQRNEEFISSESVRVILNEHFSLQSLDEHGSAIPTNAGPSRYWQAKGFNSRIGFISPHSENFCDSCNRVRLTATGMLLLCLGNEHAVDLKAIVRQHPNNKEILKSAIVDSMSIKPERHHFNLEEEPQILRFMNSTGG